MKTLALKFPARDWLTDVVLPAGTPAVGGKLAGEWIITGEPVEPREFLKLVEAVGLSCSPEAGGPDGELDHEDYRLLADFGRRYPRMAWRIGCAVPGLGDE